MAEQISPITEGQTSPKGKGAFDAFLNLLSLITLGWMSISIGAVLFQLINKFFVPQSMNYANGYASVFSQGVLKFNIASVVIITPIFLIVIAWLHKNYKTGGLNHQSGIHRWLTYLMLLISALTIIGRLVYQLFRFLDGDFAAAVILRTVVLLVIAGGIFGYYFYDLMRKDFSRRSAVSLSALIIVVVIALAAVIGGFFIIDSPATSRLRNFDNQRVNDLNNLSSLILSDYYNNNKKMPSDLAADKFSGFKNDPETGQTYEYRAVASDSFELCATFSLSAEQQRNLYVGSADWNYHRAGRQCFTITATAAAAEKIQAITP